MAGTSGNILGNGLFCGDWWIWLFFFVFVILIVIIILATFRRRDEREPCDPTPERNKRTRKPR